MSVQCASTHTAVGKGLIFSATRAYMDGTLSVLLHKIALNAPLIVQTYETECRLWRYVNKFWSSFLSEGHLSLLPTGQKFVNKVKSVKTPC